MAKIPGLTFKQIREAFQGAFDRADLDTLVRESMDEPLENMTGPNSLWHTAVSDVIKWSERRGRTTELIKAGYEFNPTHPAMMAIYQTYGLTGVDLQLGGQSTLPVKASDGGFEKTIKQRLPQLDFSVWRTKMTQVEGRICRVEIDGNPAGTGFLVGPDAVLTNYHVLEEVLKGNVPPSSVTCRFDYKMLADNSKVEGMVVRLHATDWKLDWSPFAASEKTSNPDTPPPGADELDYALIRLDRAFGNESLEASRGQGAQKRGWVMMPTGAQAFDADMPLLIAQHPIGMPLKLAMDTEAVIGVVGNGLRIRYRTNTAAGSSGSPVFDLSWKLVALHHLGDPASNLSATYNQGIPINLIRERLSKGGKTSALGGEPN